MSTVMRARRRNYLHFCGRHPQSAIQAGHYLARKVFQRITTGVGTALGRERQCRDYPPDILAAVQALIAAPFYDVQIDPATLPRTGWEPGDGADLKHFDAPLATLAMQAIDPDWSAAFDDAEDTFALHRFGWLLRWLSQRPPVEALPGALDLIGDWIDNHNAPDGSPAWETYSTCERVVNWLLFLCATSDHCRCRGDMWQHLRRALRVHLLHIGTHLEYHPAGCNNHILNNARALYIGGRLLRWSSISRLGARLLKRHAVEMIAPHGELKEGSSHYQLLVTCSFMEMDWVAATTGDDWFRRHFGPLTTRMIAFSRHLHPRETFNRSDHFPRIGDLSPDVPVDWFFPDTPAGSWWTLWDDDQWQDLLDSAEHVNTPTADAGHPCAHLRSMHVPGGQLHLTTTALPLNGTYPAVHGHLDFGGFTLSDEWGPVLCDRGRYSYRDTDTNRWSVSANGHNTSTVNDRPLIPDCQGMFCGYGRLLNSSRMFCLADGQCLHVTWSTDAIGRIASRCSWRRELVAREASVRIEERIRNPKRQPLALASHFHFAPGWSCDNIEHTARDVAVMILETPQRRYSMAITADCFFRVRWLTDYTAGHGGDYHCPDYGCRLQAGSVSLSADCDHGITITTVVARL